MGGFLKFEKMITPIFIQLIFWLGFIGSIIFGLFMIGYGMIADSGGIAQVFMGLLTMFLGPIVLRVYCEMLIVIFKMQGALISIRDALNGQGPRGNVRTNEPAPVSTRQPAPTPTPTPAQAATQEPRQTLPTSENDDLL